MNRMEALDQLRQEHATVDAEIERFAARLCDPASREDPAEGLRTLLIDIGMHFGFEEALMYEGSYADFEHHRRQHHGLMIELGLLLDRIEDAESPSLLARNADFIGQWYRQHVDHADRPLMDWLSSRG